MKRWIKENKENFMIVVEIIAGVFLTCLAFYATSLFWKNLGYETIKSDTHIEFLEVENKNIETVFIWNGKAYSNSKKYVVTVNYENEEYFIKVNSDFYDKIAVGDYVECVVNVKEKENGRRSVDVGLNNKE